MIEISIHDYEFSHGKRPRGFGSWAFFFQRHADIDAAFWVHQSTYGDAIKAARAEAKRRGESQIFVGS